eukprot:TRINITY_DN95262_c0_g1_i1.p1 TRINITY_DN95262_c0_g1~~TRINITY_DN95262_c0_g1_i1.p1  ORF type:complete len:181 (-),score=25.81 TRINITY_DN95262_c0_g1_i1:105-647(-)
MISKVMSAKKMTCGAGCPAAGKGSSRGHNMGSGLPSHAGSAPHGADVPMPSFSRPPQPRESTVDRVVRLYRDEPKAMQSLLAEVAVVLTRNTMRSRSTTGLGRALVEESRRWMRKNRLNLCSILRAFSHDFRVSKVLGVTYLHEQVKSSFVMPLQSDESTQAPSDPPTDSDEEIFVTVSL